MINISKLDEYTLNKFTELLNTHIHALYLAEIGLNELDHSLAQLVDETDQENLPLADNIKEKFEISSDLSNKENVFNLKFNSNLFGFQKDKIYEGKAHKWMRENIDENDKTLFWIIGRGCNEKDIINNIHDII